MRFCSHLLFLLVFAFAAAAMPATAQVCSGDVDGDGFLTATDLPPLTDFLFSDPPPTSNEREQSDANRDRKLSVADIVRIVQLSGLNCSQPTATPTASPSVTPVQPTGTTTMTPTATRTFTITLTPPLSFTPTPTATVTRSRTATATRTATPICAVQALQPGMVNGELTANDCVRTFLGAGGASAIRHADVYSFATTPGRAVAIEVVALATPAIRPVIRVIDAAGYFQLLDGASPVELVATVAAPYEIVVASNPASPVELGPYQLKVSTRACPTPEPLTLPDTANRTLDNSECPDTALPSVGLSVNPVDIFTFTVTTVPTNIDIVMRRVGTDSELDANLAVIGPDGFELFDPAEADDAFAGDFEGLDAQARFLATQIGTYQIIAASNATVLGAAGLEGGGRYSLSIRSPTCQAMELGTIPTTVNLVKRGTLTGNIAITHCAAPLQLPFISPDLPEVNSASDLYSFTGSAGDVISITLESTDDPHIYLYGPAADHYPLLVSDDDSSLASGDGAQLAATLPVDGTYLIVAANNFYLAAPDPDDPEDRTGDFVDYTLSVSRCSITGGLNLETGATVSTQFNNFDCRGFGDLPHRVYSFEGFAGMFATVEMQSSAINSFVRLIAPDGSVTSSDGDVLDPQSLNARVSRILPVDGPYLVEVSRSTEGQDPMPAAPPTFTLRAYSCPVTQTSLGNVNGAFGSGDCLAANGRRFDVYSAPAAIGENSVMSVLPPANGCAVGLLADGAAVPEAGCANRQVDIAIDSNPQTTGFMIASASPSTQGGYVARAAACSLPRIGYGETRNGILGPSSCVAADGKLSDWVLFRAREALVNHNDSVAGRFTPAFASASEIEDRIGSLPLGTSFVRDPDQLFLLSGDRALMFRIAGAGPGDGGAYALHIDNAFLRR